MMKKYLRNILVVALCSVAGAPVAFAADPAPFNPFTANPTIPGQTPVDWKPVPPSKPVAPPPSMDKDPAYQHAKSYSECVSSVVPSNRSPVDTEASSLAFTAQLRTAINACLTSKGVAPDPMSNEDVATTEQGAAAEKAYDPSAFARDRAERSEKTRKLIKDQGLEKYLPAEGSNGTTPVATPVATMVAPPPAMPTSAKVITNAPDTGKPPVAAATTPPPTSYVPTKTSAPARGQGVFVPSKDDGPTPVYLP